MNFPLNFTFFARSLTKYVSLANYYVEIPLPKSFNLFGLDFVKSNTICILVLKKIPEIKYCLKSEISIWQK